MCEKNNLIVSKNFFYFQKTRVQIHKIISHEKNQTQNYFNLGRMVSFFSFFSLMNGSLCAGKTNNLLISFF